MPGPPKKPTMLRKLGPRPHKKKNEKEPMPEVGIPNTPAWLDGIAKYAFKELGLELSGLKVLTKADKKALELLCDAYSEYRRARAVIIEKGMTYATTTEAGNEMVRTRPEVGISQSAWRRCSDMLKQFGLTPSARSGVEVLSEKEADPMDEFLKSGGVKVVK